MDIQAVLFDLGNTLTQTASLANALPELADSPLALELELGAPRLSRLGVRVEQIIESFYTENRSDQADWRDVWRQAGVACDIQLSPKDTERLGRAHLQHFLSQCRVEPFIYPLLTVLQRANIPLGLVSNATGPAEIFDADLQDKGLACFFQTVVWSSAIAYRKPDRRIFQAALQNLHITPGRHVIMVGDNEQADIIGGRQMGFTTIKVAGKSNHTPSAADYELAGTELMSFFETMLGEDDGTRQE